jgi:hypothetical protein
MEVRQNDAQVMTIKSQRVGIGTQSPASKLSVVTASDVNGTPTAYDDKFFTVGEGGTTGGNVFISYDQTNNRGYIGALSPSVAWRDLILNTGGGNVGIGETSPNTKLSLKGSQGAFDFTRGNTNDSHWFFSSDSARLYISETDIQSSNIKVTIDDSGNVGIGTVPTAKLDINISSNARGYFSSTIGEVGSGNFALQAVDSSGANLKPLGFRAEDIRFATGSAERLRINSSGNVVIGQSTAQQKFEVHGGGIRIAGLIDYFGSDTRFWSRGADASTVGSFKFIGLENDGGNQSTQLEIDSSGNATFSGDVTISKNANTFLNITATGGGARMKLTGQANEFTNGILFYENADLRGQINYNHADQKMEFKTGDSNTLALTIDSSQEATFADDVRLGISKKIYGQSNSTNSIEFYNGATGAMNFVSGTASYDYPMEFRQNDAQVMTIKSQRVGIGTQSPSDLLDLQDGSNANNAPRIQFGSIDTWRPVQRFYKWAGSSSLFYAWRFRLDSDFQIQTGGSTATAIGSETYTTALTLDSSQNATFNGGVNLHKANATGLTSYIGIRDSGTSSVRSGLGLGTADSTLVLYVDKNNAIGSGSALVLQTGGTDALTIDGSQNATFSGEVKSTTNITSNSGGVAQVVIMLLLI